MLTANKAKDGPRSEFVWSPDEESPFHRFAKPAVLAALKRHGARRVLDLGCGDGALTAWVASQGFEVVGYDASRSGIEQARARYPDVPFHLHDLAQPLPVEPSFDAVLSIEVIEHLLLPRKMLESAVNALRPGGMLVLTTPFHGYLKNLALAVTGGFDHHWHPLRDFGHIKFFSKRTLGALLEEFPLERIEIGTLGRVPPLAMSMFATAYKKA